METYVTKVKRHGEQTRDKRQFHIYTSTFCKWRVVAQSLVDSFQIGGQYLSELLLSLWLSLYLAIHFLQILNALSCITLFQVLQIWIISFKDIM